MTYMVNDTFSATLPPNSEVLWTDNQKNVPIFYQEQFKNTEYCAIKPGLNLFFVINAFVNPSGLHDSRWDKFFTQL